MKCLSPREKLSLRRKGPKMNSAIGSVPMSSKRGLRDREHSEEQAETPSEGGFQYCSRHKVIEKLQDFQEGMERQGGQGYKDGREEFH